MQQLGVRVMALARALLQPVPQHGIGVAALPILDFQPAIVGVFLGTV